MEKAANEELGDRQMDRSISRITISRIDRRRGNDFARRWNSTLYKRPIEEISKFLSYPQFNLG